MPPPPRFADPDTIRAVLALRTWAVVGCSPDPRRPSYDVAAFLEGQGKRVIPVHPAREYAALADIPSEEGVEVVDIFRRADQAGRHMDEAIEIGAKAVWTQLGVIDTAAAARAEAAGLLVVMDRCPKIEYPRHCR
jgi:predicted CoA-binding protein